MVRPQDLPSTQDIVDVFHALPKLQDKPRGPDRLRAARRRLQRTVSPSPRACTAEPRQRRRRPKRGVGAGWGASSLSFVSWPASRGVGAGDTPATDPVALTRPQTVPVGVRQPAPLPATAIEKPQTAPARAACTPPPLRAKPQPSPVPARALPPGAAAANIGWPGGRAALKATSRGPEASPPATPKPKAAEKVAAVGAAPHDAQQLWYDFSGSREDAPALMDVNRLAMMEVQHRKKADSLPGVLVDMERFVHSELACLNAQLGKTPSPEALASYADARMGVFRECARFFVRRFRTYGPMLGRIFREYEQYVRRAREAMGRARDLVRAAAGSRDAQAELYLRLREEFEQYDSVHRQQLEELYQQHQEGKSYFQLHEDLASAKEELVKERQHREDVTAKLAMTHTVKNEFGRTLRAIESTFNVISDEKAVRIHELEASLEALRLESSQVKESMMQQVLWLRDEVEARKVEHAAAAADLELQKESHRHTVNRAAELEKQNRLLQDELDRCEQELAEIDGGDDDDRRGRDAETIATVCQRVPDVGSESDYTSVHELCSSLCSLVEQLQEEGVELRKRIGKLERG